jgi:4-amino-4-deoxy-L-arabinose transferase-like glycosyltransferase
VSTANRLLLALILLVYSTMGVLYAVYTPPWQVPDEPAHYNYIRAIAESGRLPVMEPGDYDQGYLERITDQRDPFPPELPIDPITYQDYQPPLYYLLATPVYALFDGALLPLRLLSVALGLGLLIVAHGVIGTLFPGRPDLALTGTAFMAFLPQHVAMMAGVENDALAELLVAASLWMGVSYVKGEAGGRRFLIWWGLILGSAVLTKVSAYVALPVALLAIWLRSRRAGRSLSREVRQAGWVLVPALLLGLPWLIRNMTLYGWTDPLATVRHNLVVEGQPRTAEWLATYGFVGLARQMARTTFQSFWGQFGWMGVPLRGSVYLGLLLLTGLLVAGFVGWALDRQRPRLGPTGVAGLRLLGASALLTLLLYLMYNVTFVQHQGRYLFPALVPMGAGVALSLDWLLSRRVARWTGAALGGIGGLWVLWGLMRRDLVLVPTATALGLAAASGLAALGPRRGRWLALAALGAGLVALDIYCLFGAIVPTLAR